MSTEKMTTQIRQFQAKDLSELLAAWEKASRLAHPFLSDDFIAQERKNIAELYIPNADTWVILREQKLVGFLALIGNEIGGLFVDPAFHGQGLGWALVDQAKKLHKSLEVEVFKENQIGRRFYDRYGFKLQQEKLNEQSGQKVLRLGLIA